MSKTHQNPLDSESPFRLSLLKKQAIPLIAVFFFTGVLSFFTAGDALDKHWTTSWLLLTAGGLAISASGLLRLHAPLSWAVGMAILCIQGARGGESRWEAMAFWFWLWTWVWTLPNMKKATWQGAKAMPLFAATVGGVMLWLSIRSMWAGDWGHGASYAMVLPWAHRNMAMEALFFMCVLGGLMSKRKWILWWAFITLLALVYQVRGVLLGSLMWMLYQLWTHTGTSRWIKRSFLAVCALFVAAQVGWNSLPQETRVAQFKAAPDVLKSLDVAYNLKGAESSSIRLKLWQWTAKGLTPFGAGLGSWRNNAEGWVNLANNRCGEASRRAHSEWLQWTYELGWLPLLILMALCWPLRRSMVRWIWMSMPFLAFTFPTERAEILWPMAVLGWWLKSRFPPKEKALSSAQVTASKWTLIASFSVAFGIIGTWVVAQNALGKFMRQKGTFRIEWTDVEHGCVALHPQDIALNHAHVMTAMSEINAGRQQEGQAFLQQHLEAHPNSLTGIRVFLKLQGKRHQPEDVCRFLERRLKAPNGATTAP